MGLHEGGVITNSRKTIDRSSVEIRDGNYTNDPYVLAKNYKMTSIKTAISIDLTGQVCSESLGPVQYSGTGG